MSSEIPSFPIYSTPAPSTIPLALQISDLHFHTHCTQVVSLSLETPLASSLLALQILPTISTTSSRRSTTLLSACPRYVLYLLLVKPNTSRIVYCLPAQPLFDIPGPPIPGFRRIQPPASFAFSLYGYQDPHSHFNYPATPTSFIRPDLEIGPLPPATVHSTLERHTVIPGE